MSRVCLSLTSVYAFYYLVFLVYNNVVFKSEYTSIFKKRILKVSEGRLKDYRKKKKTKKKKKKKEKKEEESRSNRKKSKR